QAACSVLLLTATPVRADRLPIGIDVVAYTTTYRDLFERGVIVEPTFDAPILQPDWRLPHRKPAWLRSGTHEPDSGKSGLNPDTRPPGPVRALADYVLDRTAGDIQKALVVVSRKEHAPLLHQALAEALEDRPGHVLGA